MSLGRRSAWFHWNENLASHYCFVSLFIAVVHGFSFNLRYQTSVVIAFVNKTDADWSDSRGGNPCTLPVNFLLPVTWVMVRFSSSLFASLCPWKDGKAERTDAPQRSSAPCYWLLTAKTAKYVNVNMVNISAGSQKYKMHLQILNLLSKNRRTWGGDSTLLTCFSVPGESRGKDSDKRTLLYTV